MKKLTLQHATWDAPRTFQLERDGDVFTVSSDGQAFSGSVTSNGPGTGWLRLDGRIHRFHLARHGDSILLWIDGQCHAFETINPVARRGAGDTATGSASNQIKAPMPGTILQVLAAPGDAVSANQPLVIMESMKMEMTLAAPRDATIASVDCQAGQLVEMNAVLVLLDQA